MHGQIFIRRHGATKKIVFNAFVYFCNFISQVCLDESEAPSFLLILMAYELLFLNHKLVQLLMLKLSQSGWKRWIDILAVSHMHHNWLAHLTLAPQSLRCLLPQSKILKITHFLHIKLHLPISHRNIIRRQLLLRWKYFLFVIFVLCLIRINAALMMHHICLNSWAKCLIIFERSVDFDFPVIICTLWLFN